MKVFVTGADGFIGSHVVETLVRAGHQVKALALYNSFDNLGWLADLDADVFKQIEVVKGDIRDAFMMQEQIRGFDAVLHLASLIAIPYSYHAPSSYVETNVTGTLNVLQAARAAGVSRFIHTSTSEVYGTAQTVPISEAHRLYAQSPYAATKIAADQLAQSFYCSFELPVTIIRPFNTYGPRQSERAIIPTIIGQLLRGQTELQLGNLTPTRDLTFVQDTANGFLAALNASGIAGETINLGANFEISIGDLVHEIAGVVGSSVTIQQEEQRLRPEKSEVNRLWSNNQKALELMGWAPELQGIDGLRDGLKRTVAWFAGRIERSAQKDGKYVI